MSVNLSIDRSVKISVDMFTEISAEYRSICRPTLNRYVNHWLPVKYRSTVSGMSVDSRGLYYNQASIILDCSQSPIFPWDRRCRSSSSTGRHLSLSIWAKLEKCSRNTVCYSEQIMSADKIIAYFRARWRVLFLYTTIISWVMRDQVWSPVFNAKIVLLTWATSSLSSGNLSAFEVIRSKTQRTTY